MAIFYPKMNLLCANLRFAVQNDASTANKEGNLWLTFHFFERVQFCHSKCLPLANASGQNTKEDLNNYDQLKIGYLTL